MSATRRCVDGPLSETLEAEGKELRPLHDRILERLEAQAAKQGGILIPDTANEKRPEGRVVAAGNGKVTRAA